MKTLLLTILLLSFGQAQASFQSGSMLLENCETHINKTSPTRSHACFGYIEGIADVHTTFSSWKEIDKRWCTPDKINSKQLVRIVVKYLQERPEALHHAAGSLVANALNDAFPCEAES
jgi:hypothetical protein